MKTGCPLTSGVVAGLLGAGVIWLIASPPRGEAVRLLPPPIPSPIVVHVLGGVHNPGVYALPDGSRVLEAVDAAGGLLPEAEPRSINLAALLADGDQIRIGQQSTGLEPGSPVEDEPHAPLQPGHPSTITTTGPPININTASSPELESLPGIGPVTAQKIIEYRRENGPFGTIADIQQVSGIGPATFEQIRPLITTGTDP